MNGTENGDNTFEGDATLSSGNLTNSTFNSITGASGASTNDDQDEPLIDYMGAQAILTYIVGFCILLTILWLRFAKFPNATTSRRPQPRRRYHPDNGGDEESIRSFRTILDYLKVREWRSSARSDTASLSSSNHSSSTKKKRRRSRSTTNIDPLDDAVHDSSLEEDDDPDSLREGGGSRGVSLASFFQHSSSSSRPHLFRRNQLTNKKETKNSIPDTAIVITPETVKPEGVLTPNDVKQQATMDIDDGSVDGALEDADGVHRTGAGPSSGGDDEGAICCAICLETFHDHEKVCQSKNNPDCPHAFHLSCMTEWLAKHDSCPICRQLYLGGNSTV